MRIGTGKAEEVLAYRFKLAFEAFQTLPPRLAGVCINSLVQAAKARARGYRTTENFITIARNFLGPVAFE